MRSITLEQASAFAALAMLLLAGFHLADNYALLESSPALVLLGSVVPSVVWAGFFFIVYRSPGSAPAAAWITLIFAAILEALVVYVRFQQSVSYWTPFGDAFSLSGWLLRLGWVAFLIAFALNKDHLRTRRLALVLAIFSAPSAVRTAYDAFNFAIGFLVGDIPGQAYWRALITPALRTFYWLSQILFLWTVWENRDPRNRVEAPSSRLAP